MSAGEEEYVVDRVVAQSELEDGETVYLVRWEGYGDEQCTWEPRESFTSEATIQQWERDQAEGKVLPPDEYEEILDKIESYIQAQEIQREEAKHRQLKRKGASDSPVSSAESHSTPSSPLTATNRAPQKESSSNRTSINTNGLLHKQIDASIAPKRFHGAGIVSKARKSRIPLHPPRQPGAGGPLFKTLRRQNQYQKRTRNERAPDPSSIRLFSATESVAEPGGDVAHNLPRGTVQQPAVPAKASQPSNNQQSAKASATESGSATDPTRLLETPNSSKTSIAKPLFQRSMSALPNGASAMHTLSHGKTGGIKWTQNGRFWRHGEILVKISYGDNNVIGDVRLCLPSRFFRSFISLKRHDCIDINFRTADVLTRAGYETLCAGRSNEILFNTELAGFDDTNPKLKNFANVLLESELAALWYHPEAPYVLIAYSVASKSWNFLRATSEEQLSVDSPMCVALRNAMPGPVNAIPCSLYQQQSKYLRPYTRDEGLTMQTKSLQDGAPASLPSPNIPRSKSSVIPQAVLSENLTTFFAHDSCVGSKNTDEVTHQTMNVPLSPSTFGQTNVSKGQRGLPTVRLSTKTEAPDRRREDDMSIDSRSSTLGQSDEARTSMSSGSIPFEKKHSITYEHLTRPTFKSRSVVDTKRTRFFLAFPQAASSEEASLRQYLRRNTMPSLIFTNDNYGWDTFKEFTGSRGDKQGVIILHASVTDYAYLSGLATQLLKSENVNVFRMSLETGINENRMSTHCERLFPKGRVAVITESTMHLHPVEALIILKWFHSMTRKRHGTWKLFLRPNVKYWLERQAVAFPHKKSNYLDMLTVVKGLTRDQSPAYYICDSDQSDAEAYEGDDEDRGKAGVLVSPGSLSGYPLMSSMTDVAELEKLDALLLEYFAAWACLHADSIRRFTAVSPFFRSEWNRWGHIEILSASEYMQENNVRISAADGTTEW